MLPYLSASLAIYERLVGWPIDSNGNPLRGADGRPSNRLIVAPPYHGETDANGIGRYPSYGIRIPLLQNGYDSKHFLTTHTPDAVRLFERGFQPGAFRQVPVFFEGIKGRPWEKAGCCVTFRMISDAPRSNTYHFYEPICEESTATTTITDIAGDPYQTGPDQLTVVQHPNGLDLSFMIVARSRDAITHNFLCSQIRMLFPEKGVLEVRQSDDSVHPCDMLMTGSRTMDIGGDDMDITPGPEGEGERTYIRAYLYRVEAYEDTTSNKFGYSGVEVVNTITQRILTITNMQEQLIDGPIDLNSLEEAGQ